MKTKKLLALHDALDAAKRACDERRREWERTMGMRAYVYDPHGAQLKANMLRARAALKRGEREFNCDPRIEDLRALVRAELELARDAFEAMAEKPPTLASVSDARAHADALERFLDRDAQTERITRRVAAAYGAVRAARELLAAERASDKRLPAVPGILPSLAAKAPRSPLDTSGGTPRTYTQVCAALVALDDSNVDKDLGSIDEVLARECEAGIAEWRETHPDDAEHLDRVEAARHAQAAE